ncbi:MAG: hypothetical protein Q4F21_01585 [Lachnospiraceae bacterium]|nr:hypothetical protein [Lachnospiraceae bacterium]
MEQKVEFLEGFLKELGRYCDASGQTDNWYESMKKKLGKDQEMRRVRNEDSYRQQQAAFKAMQEKAVRERDEMQEKIRGKIFQKKELMRKNIETNLRVRDRILSRKNEILRPEFFQYAYRYRAYGDFYPQITRLEDYKELDLAEMIDRINDNKTSLWINRLKVLFKSEDMMVEYASFANLIGKARYLCEVDNDALREKGNVEIQQLEKQLEEADERFMEAASEAMKKQKKIQIENEAYQKMFEQACEAETRHLREDYQNRQMKNYEAFRDLLKEKYPSQEMEQIYKSFEEAERAQKKFICSDGIPLPAKLGRLWFEGTETLKNTYIKQLLEKDYAFMIHEGRLSIPGIA